MTNPNVLAIRFPDSNEAIFFDGSRKNSISFIVDMFSNDVDSAWRSCDEVRLGCVIGLEGVKDGLVPF